MKKQEYVPAGSASFFATLVLVGVGRHASEGDETNGSGKLPNDVSSSV